MRKLADNLKLNSQVSTIQMAIQSWSDFAVLLGRKKSAVLNGNEKQRGELIPIVEDAKYVMSIRLLSKTFFASN